jgi:hypothetical protein
MLTDAMAAALIYSGLGIACALVFIAGLSVGFGRS